jgi:6-phosphogluconolactonase (cycloisomerase 2 family)
MLFVIDLGADLVRSYSYDDAGALLELAVSATPSGTGPRHGVFDGDGGLWITGELASSVLYGRPQPDGSVTSWQVMPSTAMTGPGKSRTGRNYPGDIARVSGSNDVVMANRGYDTLARFGIRDSLPTMISEVDSTVSWPQHLLFQGDDLLVAGWDSSEIVRFTAGGAIERCAAPGPVWFLA